MTGQAQRDTDVVARELATRRRESDDALGDLRFCTLLGAEQWALLPPAVRARFSKRLGLGRVATYAGEILECEIGWAGRALAQLARLVGAPLPLTTDVFVPAFVAVSEEPDTQGQLWTRMYGRRRGFPQVIHSAKRFAGPTGLEEYIGCGIGIALSVDAEATALHFRSDHYFVRLFGLRLRWPRWLAPGALTVSHVDCNDGWFAFVLDLSHPRFGPLIHQVGLFREHVAA